MIYVFKFKFTNNLLIKSWVWVCCFLIENMTFVTDRAEKKLKLIHASKRQIHGQLQNCH